MLGLNLFGSEFTRSGIEVQDMGVSVSYSYGLYDKMSKGFIKSVELSASIPFINRKIDDETETGPGEAVITGKLHLLEEDAYRPGIPSIAVLGSLILPTAKEEFERTEGVGLEVGGIIGKTITDSMGLMNFRIYGEVLAGYLERNDEPDFFFRGSAGMAFPVGIHENLFMLAEYGFIERSGVPHEEGYTFLLGVQYVEAGYNGTIGFMSRYMDDIDTYERKFILSYEMKF
jgi:hypothetical protein